MTLPVVFVDVDTQFDFMNPRGNLYLKGAEELVPNLSLLSQQALKKNVPVIATADAHLEDDPEFKDFPPHCVVGTPGQQKIEATLLDPRMVIKNVRLPAEVELTGASGRPLYAQYVLEKQSFSFFGNVNVDRVLKELLAENYVVYGVATDYCVKEAVMGLLEHDAKVRVVKDAIAPVDPEKEEAVLEQLEKAGAQVITTQTALNKT